MKNSGGMTLDWINIDAHSNQPLFLQLFTQIQHAILENRLRSGARLPSTRAIAKQIGVSRNTVITAFEQLVAEGYVNSTTGSGTCVVDELPDDSIRLPRVRKITLKPPPAVKATVYQFSPSLPAVDSFPLVLWRKIANQISRNHDPASWMDYGDAVGYLPLRLAISDYLNASRGLNCDADRIIITSGSQQALDLLSRLLLKKDDIVLLEEPCYPGARCAFTLSNANIIGVEVDEQGMQVESAIANHANARLAMVTPSHQYPLGPALSLNRRLLLLDWAKSASAWIVEDDYGGELRYEGRPLMALQSLDTEQRVLYLGSFSKVLFPALRLGYIVLPEKLVKQFRELKYSTDSFAPVFPQMQVCEFMVNNHFTSHIRKMRSLYIERQAAMLQALDPLNDILATQASAAGMHLVGALPSNFNDQWISSECEKHALRIPALSKHYFHPGAKKGLLLGFASTPVEKMQQAVKILEKVLRAM